MIKYLLITVGMLAGWPLNAAGANPGDEVLVVYNKRVPESKGVADHYAELRHVPTNQIWGFELSTAEEISRSEFQDSLQRPLAKKLEDSKLWMIGSHIIPASSNQPGRVDWLPRYSKIRYLVLCYGVPLRISKDANLKEDLPENTRPELRRNEAAVDNELAVLPLIQQKMPLAGPLRNPLYSQTNGAQLHPTNGVLMVTRLDGPTAAIARSLVDKAVRAEKEGFWGRAYFDLRNTTDPNLKIGDDWIRAADELSRRLGFESVTDTNSGTFPVGFPMSQIAVYIGWYDEHVSGPFTRPTVEFMPGAFAYHLHSFSAASLRSTTRNWVGPLLAKGVTITMGSVDEPYLSGTPDPAVFMARLVFHRLRFGEAAYAAQSVLSWQTTVVGDPLFQPFGKDPESLHLELERSGNKNLEWSYLRLANLNLANGKPVAEWVSALESFDLTKKSAVLSEKLGDLYLQQGKPSSAVHSYSEALKLGPSPQQRIRLLLTLGEKLTSLDRAQEAYEKYQELLKLSDDYPDKATLYKKLIALAQKLSRPADVEKYEQESKRL